MVVREAMRVYFKSQYVVSGTSAGSGWQTSGSTVNASSSTCGPIPHQTASTETPWSLRKRSHSARNNATWYTQRVLKYVQHKRHKIAMKKTLHFGGRRGQRFKGGKAKGKGPGKGPSLEERKKQRAMSDTTPSRPGKTRAGEDGRTGGQADAGGGGQPGESFVTRSASQLLLQTDSSGLGRPVSR